jgi:hypothetical protein
MNILPLSQVCPNATESDQRLYQQSLKQIRAFPQKQLIAVTVSGPLVLDTGF